jgi:GAF domain/Phosphoserine phosphatase RsbU, N-terminal domain
VNAWAGRGPVAFRAAYRSAFLEYLLDPGETTLRVAYELGREAVTRQLSVLDLAVAHHEAILSAFAEGSSSPEDARHVAEAAGDFFLESLATFEMVQRGLREAREAALVERRQTEMSRQLSSFLADASLALDSSDSLEEMLRLVAEQARELVGADCCVATLTLDGVPRAAEAASFPEMDRGWTALIRWLDLPAVLRLVRLNGGSVRMDEDDLSQLPPFRSPAGKHPLRGWLAASLTTLNGGELGVIQLFNKQDGAFTEDDEAAAVHLAQMASAAVERARLYQEQSSSPSSAGEESIPSRGVAPPAPEPGPGSG